MQNKKTITVMFLLNTTVMGGANISLINLIKELYKYKIDMYIVHPDNAINPLFLEETQNMIKAYYKVDLSSQIYYENNNIRQTFRKILKKILCINWLRKKREIYQLSKIVRTVRPDIIHTNTGVIHAGYFVANKYKIPHVWHIREYQTKDFKWEIYPSKEKLVSYLKDSYVIAITHDILNYFGLKSTDRSLCVYNGCFSYKSICTILPKEKFFLCCSRISAEKGQDEVVKAFSLVHKKYGDYRLIIAGFGDEEYICYLHTLSKELGCDDAIDFVGFKKDIRPYMDHATALIVASRFEGFGRMTAEAAFRGCMVIGNYTGGTKEILDQIGGIPYSNGYKDLAKKMENVIRLSQYDYKKIIDKAQKVAVELYSNEASAKNVYDLYTSIVH